MLPKVAIIYLSYNSHKYVKDVFLSLEYLNYPKEKLEIIVVDNNSQDGSQEIFGNMEGITFFPNKINVGFAKGNNIGIEHALLNDADYVYLLNNDACLHTDAIYEAVMIAESDEEIGSVQSILKLWNNEKIINSSGGMVHFLGFGFARDNGEKSDYVMLERGDGQEIAYSSGASVLYKASTLRRVGLLDPFLFLYHEDLELGWRMRLAGYRNVLSLKSIAYHDYEFKRSMSKFFWMERNRYLVHLSHLKLKTLVLLLPLMVLLEVPLIFFSIKSGWFKEKLFVYIQLLKPSVWKYIFKKRKQSEIIRKVSDKKIFSIFTGKIENQEVSHKLVDNLANPILNFICSIYKRIIAW